MRAAEQEGQVIVYIAGYEAVIESGAFQKTFAKIKVVSVTGSGTQLAPRIATERRAGKYLADVYNGGGSSLYQVLHLGKMLAPRDVHVIRAGVFQRQPDKFPASLYPRPIVQLEAHASSPQLKPF